MRLAATALLLSLSLMAAAEERSLIGYWVNPDDPDDATAFEKDRAITLDHGAIQYWMARYTAGKVVLGWLGEASLPYHWQGNDIIIDVPKHSEWHRVLQMPASLQEPVVAIPAPRELDAAGVQAISDSFVPRINEDQAVRKDPSRGKERGAVDRDNTAWLKKLIADVGWIDGTRFGKHTAGSAFLLVQHSGDLPLMQATLPLIKADLALGVCDPQDFALLYDRVQIMTGRRQRYGSQIGQAMGKSALFPLEDRARVDDFRREIGLFPLQTYLAMFQQMMKTQVLFMDEMPVAGIPGTQQASDAP